MALLFFRSDFHPEIPQERKPVWRAKKLPVLLGVAALGLVLFMLTLGIGIWCIRKRGEREPLHTGRVNHHIILHEVSYS